MMQNFPSIALSVLVFTGGIVSCSAASIAEKIPQQQMSRIPSPASSSSTALEQSIHQQINEYRQSRNLPPLTLDSRISAQALAHSQAMASGIPLSHDGFEERTQAIRKSISYRAAAENVAFNQGYSNPDVQAVQGWIESPGHRVNIEGQYDLTGIGIAQNSQGEYYFTQIFIRSR